MRALNLREESAYDRDVWREAIKTSNPTRTKRRKKDKVIVSKCQAVDRQSLSLSISFWLHGVTVL